MKRSCWRSLWGAGCAALAIAACSGKEEPAHGELMVAVDSDMSVPKDVTHIRIDVLLNNALTYQYDFQIAPDGQFHLPGTLAIVAGAQDNPTVSVEVIGIRTGQSGKKEARTFSKVVTTVPKSRIALLRVPVQWLCDRTALDLGNDSYTTTCDPVGGKETACLAGSCMPVEVQEDSLPSYEPPLVFGGGSGPNAGGTCFDTIACFGVGQDVTPAADCSLTVPSSVATPNLALVTAPGGDGICHADPNANCLIPLDQDERSGWHYRATPDGAPRVIELPPAVCSKLAQGSVQGLRLATDCATKTAQTPTCGPWSSVDVAGGVDAGNGDAGNSDASMPDGGSDASAMTDSGTMLDGSMPDASMPDAMQGDGSMPPDAGADSGSDGGAHPPPDPDPLTPCTDPVVISDPNLDAAIHSLLGLEASTPISAAAAANLTTLNANGLGIARLNGIQCFPNLATVYLEGNQLTSVAAFALCPALQTLELYSNQIVDPGPLALATTLTHLGLARNQLTDPSSLAALSHLTYLDLSQNAITDPSKLAPLYSALAELTYLDASKANLSDADVSAIAGMTSLQRLQIGENTLITDVAPLAALTNLNTLDIRHTQVSSLSALSSLPLTSLALMQTQLTSLSDLIPFGANLTELYVDSLPLANVGDALMLVGSFTNLQILGMGGDKLTSVAALSGLYQLKTLQLDDNQLTDISPLQSIEGLSFLSVGNNQIADLSPVQYFISLNYLAAYTNQITTLAPLVNNANIAGGDTVLLQSNPLDCTAEAANIAALVGRGVSLQTSCP